MTPVWRSARTLVVPPGVSDILLLGEGGNWTDDGREGESEELDADTSSDGSETARDVRLGAGVLGCPFPSSASARALPSGGKRN